VATATVVSVTFGGAPEERPSAEVVVSRLVVEPAVDVAVPALPHPPAASATAAKNATAPRAASKNGTALTEDVGRAAEVTIDRLLPHPRRIGLSI
jgi:hypothetical protein